MTSYYVMTFPSTHSAIETHKKLKDIPGIVMMPTLREIQASCGISLRIPVNAWEACLRCMGTLETCDLYEVHDGTVKKLDRAGL